MNASYRILGWMSALCFLGIFALGMLQSVAHTGAPPGIHTGYNGALDVLLIHDEEPDKAISQLELALEIVVNERHIQHTNLGVALEGLGQQTQAMEHYRHALAIRPDHAGAHAGLGSLLVATGEVSEGLAYLEEARRLAPSDPDVVVNIARVHGQSGEHSRAEGLYREALELSSDHPTAHYNLARTLHLQGRVQEAEPLYLRALALDASYEGRALRHLAKIMVSQRRWKEASAALKRAMVLSPDQPGLALEAAKALTASGDLAAAQPLLERYASEGELDNPEALTLLARILATHTDPSRRDPVRALKLASRANELTGGNHPAVLDALASAYAAQGRYGEATKVANEAIVKARAMGNEGLARVIESRLPRYASPRDPESEGP